MVWHQRQEVPFPMSIFFLLLCSSDTSSYSQVYLLFYVQLLHHRHKISGRHLSVGVRHPFTSDHYASSQWSQLPPVGQSIKIVICARVNYGSSPVNFLPQPRPTHLTILGWPKTPWFSHCWWIRWNLPSVAATWGSQRQRSLGCCSEDVLWSWECILDVRNSV